ncbi:putative dynamin stalk domain, Dynamin superfamily [Helianthus annuus]|nr:putative dynamin stalk domain, Dynamin superfamily [Helianthus annuus]
MICAEVDPCEELTDDDIRTAIQDASGPRSTLFVPEVPFEVLIRRQIARLLDPCMSHSCMVNELQRFPVLREQMDDVTGNFLHDGLQSSETMIGHVVEMEVHFIILLIIDVATYSKFFEMQKITKVLTMIIQVLFFIREGFISILYCDFQVIP